MHSRVRNFSVDTSFVNVEIELCLLHVLDDYYLTSMSLPTSRGRRMSEGGGVGEEKTCLLRVRFKLIFVVLEVRKRVSKSSLRDNPRKGEHG